MKTSNEIRAALRSVSQGAGGIRHDALAMRVYSLLEDENLTIPEEFQTAANTSAEILDNLNAAQRPPRTADLLTIAADPKKLKAHLTDSATAAAMTATLRKEVLTELNRTTNQAAVKAAGQALKEFVAANSASGLYAPTQGTEGEQMVAQEKRNRLNASHDQLLKASVGGERLDESAAICFRWTYTTDQWAALNDIFHWNYSQPQWVNFTADNPTWKAPSTDEAAIRVGATHRLAESYSQALEDAERCIDAIQQQEEKERSERNRIAGTIYS